MKDGLADVGKPCFLFKSDVVFVVYVFSLAFLRKILEIDVAFCYNDRHRGALCKFPRISYISG